LYVFNNYNNYFYPTLPVTKCSHSSFAESAIVNEWPFVVVQGSLLTATVTSVALYVFYA